MASVELRDVTKRFSPEVLGLDGVSLSVDEGRVLVILGRSGSGKTTALKTINGLVRPDHGSVHALGQDVASTDVIALRRRIGYVIQEAGLLPHLTVGENVSLVPRLLRWPEEKIASRTREMLSLVGLEPDRFLAQPPAKLSGGERQRAGLARALAADPPLLLMDEPFGALDPVTRRRLQAEFRGLQRRLAKTVVLVTHDVAEAFRLADDVAVMDEGRVLQHGPAPEVRRAPAPGYVAELLAAGLS